MWELLFFGTVPIILSGPLDPLLVDAHVPVIIVSRWKDVCAITDDEYTAYALRYEHWIANILLWLEPRNWVPRDQRRFEELCDMSVGCREKGGSHFIRSSFWF